LYISDPMTANTTRSHGDGSERRGHRRGPVRGQAAIGVGAEALRCDVGNLSRSGGLFVLSAVCPAPIALGAPVSVSLDVLDRAIRLQGRVVRSDDGGTRIAIAFDDVPDEVCAALDQQVDSAIDAARVPRVVVVDPLPAERGRVADAVRRAGCDPVEASTPLEAIDAIQRPENRVAAAAIRDSLTQTGGDELATYLAEQHPTLPVAILAEAPTESTTQAGPREVPVLAVDGDLTGPLGDLVKPDPETDAKPAATPAKRSKKKP
jgi:hypothetical protein